MSFATEDVVYRVVGQTTLLARLYRPRTLIKTALIEVHGGAWIGNDRLTNAAIHEYLAARGVAVLAIDFRMGPAHPYPAALEDVNYAIAWFKANRARLELPLTPIGGLGTSSGGHLIMLHAIRPETYGGGLGTHGARLDFVIGCWPILDPLARYRMAKAKGLTKLVQAHESFWPDEAAMAHGNPHLIVERGLAEALPAALILQGTADDNVEAERARSFALVYERAGGCVELHTFEGQPHAFIPKSPSSPASLEALSIIEGFIERLSAEPAETRPH